MNASKTNRFLAAFVFASIAGQALHRFITPLSHADVGIARTGAVAVQAVLGLFGACWFIWGGRRNERPAAHRA